MYQMFCVPKNSVEGCQHFCCVRCFKPATCLLIILYIEQQREASEHIITLGSCGFAISVFWLYWILQCAFFQAVLCWCTYPSIKYKGHACWIVSTEFLRVGRWVLGLYGLFFSRRTVSADHLKTHRHIKIPFWWTKWYQNYLDVKKF